MTESSERIGEDVLGSAPPSRMDKRKAELMAKAKKEVEKKRKEEEDEDNIKLPKLPIPDDQHELSALEIAEIEQRARVTGASFQHERKVFVSEHYRSKPKRAKKKQEEKKRSFFDFP
jgi:hypothetical protein